MREQLLELIARNHVVSRADALRVVPKHVVDDAVRSGAVVRLFPGVYSRADICDDREVRRHAALVHRPRGALSHTDGLDVWDLPTAVDPNIHLTVPADEPSTRLVGLTLHRRQGFLAASPAVVVRRGLRVVRLEQAIVESRPLAAGG